MTNKRRIFLNNRISLVWSFAWFLSVTLTESCVVDSRDIYSKHAHGSGTHNNIFHTSLSRVNLAVTVHSFLCISSGTVHCLAENTWQDFTSYQFGRIREIIGKGRKRNVLRYWSPRVKICMDTRIQHCFDVWQVWFFSFLFIFSVILNFRNQNFGYFPCFHSLYFIDLKSYKLVDIYN